jgi:hypothetical protein
MIAWLVLLFLAVVMWEDFVEATGDTLDECDRGRCGTLGEFPDDHPSILFGLLALGAVIAATAIAWAVGRLFRPPERGTGSKVSPSWGG